MFGSLLNITNPLRQVFSTAVAPVQSSEVHSLDATDVATFHGASVTAVLPAQLQSLNKGQSVDFQRKSVEYYKKLVKEGEINPKTVTPTEFVAKATPIADHDPFSMGWSWIARHLLAMNLVSHTMTSGNRERSERADADYQLEQVREIGLKQLQARKEAMGRDQMLISQKALDTSRAQGKKA